MVKLAILLIILSSPLAYAKGKFISPFDVCWSCVFPIHLGGVNITPNHKDFIEYDVKPLCHCKGGLIGVPISFWEPTKLIDVTRTPYKLVGLGGFSIKRSSKRKGCVKPVIPGIQDSSFYHAHVYQFPVMFLFDFGLQLFCEDRSKLAILYMSEFDPLWMVEKWSAIINPETIFFSNPLAQGACIADCVLSSLQIPSDRLFWCAGCHQNTIYPLIGHVGHHIGGLQASSLIAQRALVKLHSRKALSVFKPNEYCESYRPYKIKKTGYKTQIVYPIPQTKGPCQALGKSSALWGKNKTYPFGGEDFVYLIWTKKHCNLDPAKAAVKATLKATLESSSVQ